MGRYTSDEPPPGPQLLRPTNCCRRCPPCSLLPPPRPRAVYRSSGAREQNGARNTLGRRISRPRAASPFCRSTLHCPRQLPPFGNGLLRKNPVQGKIRPITDRMIVRGLFLSYLVHVDRRRHRWLGEAAPDVPLTADHRRRENRPCSR